MLHDNTYKNRETGQRLVCNYDLFRQTLRLKEGHEQTNVLLLRCSVYMQCAKCI